MKDLIGKYIGPNRIKEIILSEKKTLKGKEVYEVIYPNEVKQEFPLKVLLEVATKKQKDLNILRDLRVLPVIKEILEIITEADIKAEDIRYCIGKMQHSISESVDRAFKVKWGKEKYEQTLMDIHRILVDNNQENTTMK